MNLLWFYTDNSSSNFARERVHGMGMVMVMVMGMVME